MWRKWKRQRIARLAPLDVDGFAGILREDLCLARGDVVFVHSSIDYLNLGFSFFRVFSLLQEVVGPEGTLVFPTYPRLSSFEFLQRAEVFDVRKTPSYTGSLTEIARRNANAVRSLHPTKSVCAIGPQAVYLTAAHHESPYPYDIPSPYYRLAEVAGKVVGLGVPTSNLSLVHSVDDVLGERFPVFPYHDRLFRASCVDAQDQRVVVPTYAHDMRKMLHNVPLFLRRHIRPEVCKDLNIQGRSFFRGDVRTLLDDMLELAQRGITIYPRSISGRRAAA
jgi:aminoglycoside N3'-acetyltransferase